MTAIDRTPPSWLKSATIKAENDRLATEFKILCREYGLPQPIREYLFDTSPAKRRWKLDFAWPNVDAPGGLALEQQGGLYSGGRHVRGKALEEEHQKLNAAASQDWRVLFCTPQSLCNSATLDLVRLALR